MNRIAIYPVCLLLIAAAFPPAARADLSSDFLPLDWLIDSSDMIVVVEVTQADERKITKTEAVFKTVDASISIGCIRSERLVQTCRLAGAARVRPHRQGQGGGAA